MDDADKSGFLGSSRFGFQFLEFRASHFNGRCFHITQLLVIFASLEKLNGQKI